MEGDGNELIFCRCFSSFARCYGAFNISLITDLPLFIDPFLLFHSDKKEYRQLHDHMISYLRFLKEKSERGRVSPGLLKSLYCFSEVRQDWLGFCKTGNTGRGLGSKFAAVLDVNLVHVFRNFGEERITKGSHLEKLCLIESGVGRDMISDFSTNLIKHYLLGYTEAFAREYIDSSLTLRVSVGRSVFDHSLEGWIPQQYQLPYYEGDYVVLAPKNIPSKRSWIAFWDSFWYK